MTYYEELWLPCFVDDNVDWMNGKSSTISKDCKFFCVWVRWFYKNKKKLA